MPTPQQEYNQALNENCSKRRELLQKINGSLAEFCNSTKIADEQTSDFLSAVIRPDLEEFRKLNNEHLELTKKLFTQENGVLKETGLKIWIPEDVIQRESLLQNLKEPAVNRTDLDAVMRRDSRQRLQNATSLSDFFQEELLFYLNNTIHFAAGTSNEFK